MTILYTPSVLGVVVRGVPATVYLSSLYRRFTAFPRAPKERLNLWGKQETPLAAGYGR